jgi:hypothetical protein
LKAVVFYEGRLQRVKLARFAESFNGGDIAILVLHSERKATVDT